MLASFFRHRAIKKKATDAQTAAPMATDPRARTGVVLTPVVPARIHYARAEAIVGGYVPLRDIDGQAWIGRFGILKTEAGFEVLAIPTVTMAEMGEMVQRVMRTKNIPRAAIKVLHVEEEALKIWHITHQPLITGDVETRAQQMSDMLIEQAIVQKASDIHLLVQGMACAVRFRIYGELYEQPPLSRDSAMMLCNYLYTVASDEKTKATRWHSDRPQDSALFYVSKQTGRRFVVRFSSVDVYPSDNENVKVVMRVNPLDEVDAPTLDAVGFTPDQQRKVDEIISGAHGLVLLVGPTRSGKSTTMQAMVRAFSRKRHDRTAVMTIEDPVEFMIKGAAQCNVRETPDISKEENFASYLKAALRQDTDIVVVGEVRDAMSADITKDMVLTGRKVFSTIHSYDTLSVFTRLVEIGIPPSVLFMPSFISGIIAQRVLPRLCGHCALPWVEACALPDFLDRGLVERLSVAFSMIGQVEDPLEGLRFRSPTGCPHCQQKGIVGSALIAEIIQPDATYLKAVKEGRLEEAQNWAARGHVAALCGRFGVSMLSHALLRAEAGEVDARDVEALVGAIRLRREVHVEENLTGAGMNGWVPSFSTGPASGEINTLGNLYS
jgi:general secretion pathway protein E